MRFRQSLEKAECETGFACLARAEHQHARAIRRQRDILVRSALAGSNTHVMTVEARFQRRKIVKQQSLDQLFDARTARAAGRPIDSALDRGKGYSSRVLGCRSGQRVAVSGRNR